MTTNSQAYPSAGSALIRLVLGVAFVLFVAGGLLFGYLFVSALQDRMNKPLNPADSEIPILPATGAGSSTSSSSSGVNPNGVQATGAWTGKQRVNILLLGMDQREGEAGQPSRTDTMILATLDPVGKTMGMLSIPRDLWVAIPGLAKPLEERINSAHFYGDLYKYPGGGAVLAKKTVQYNLGIPVHYYVRLDFKGFERIVDALGGVTINVEKAIRDDEYPDAQYGTISIYIPAGLQHMDGETALRYVRTRHADSDFGRTRRQLQFLMAMRDQALKLNILPRLPNLISQLRDSVKTDLSANEIIALARVASQVETENITTRSIDEKMITPWLTPQGGDVLIPKRDEIKKLVDEMFGPVASAATPTPVPPGPTPLPTPRQSSEDRERLRAENAGIEILNGTNTKGLAARTRTYLTSLGYNVVTIGDAGRYDYKETVIVYYAEKRYTQQSLIKLFGVRPENVRLAPSARMEVDIRIILGANAQVP